MVKKKQKLLNIIFQIKIFFKKVRKTIIETFQKKKMKEKENIEKTDIET